VADQFAVPVDPTGLDLQFRVATSVLDEFALSHTPADVLRELVQNEYDAGGNGAGRAYEEDTQAGTAAGAVREGEDVTEHDNRPTSKPADEQY
jgi:hypothetical protein